MPGTFFGIEIARRGLNVHRTALETTGHNVANANTPGYTRQEAVISASDPFTIPSLETKLLPGQLGTGVLAEMVRRIRNEYLDTQARDCFSSREYWQIQEELFNRIEAVFPEPASSGIAEMLTKFFNCWQDLNNSPQDPGVKAAVAEAGDELATMMREAYRQLQDISTSILKTGAGGTVTGGQMKDQVDTVNDILTQIRELTESIKTVYAHGNQPNDLLDKRDLLIDQLAEYGPVNVVYKTAGGKPTGEIALTFFGEDVRPADVSVSLQYTATPSEEVKLVIGNGASNTEISLTNYPAGLPKTGSLPGLEEVRGRLAAYQKSLDDLSLALASTVNQVHNPVPPGTGQNFFTGSLAGGDFAVAGAVMANPTVIDGKRALFIARLATVGMDGNTAILGKDENGNDVTVTTYDLQGATFGEHFHGLLTDIGARSSTASDMTQSQQAVAEQMETLRQSAAGVNIDEELTRLIQFQYGYQASARVLTVLDEMLDHLINRTG